MWFEPTNLRIALGVLLFLSVLFFPPYMTAIVAFILAARWRAWEVVVAGICMDLLWMPSSASFVSLESLPLATCIAIILVVLLDPLRRQLLL